MRLLDRVQGYLGAQQYEVSTPRADLVRGMRPGVGGTEEAVLVWVPDVGERDDFSSLASHYLKRFRKDVAEHAAATTAKVVLVDWLAGVSGDFTQQAKQKHGVSVLVPAQFFDMPFKWEVDKRLATSTKELRDRGALLRTERIAQPYRVRGADEGGPDLYEFLLKVLRNPSKDRPSIHVVVGPAGMGKSHMFGALYATLYEVFFEDKNQHMLSPRPFALVPERVHSAYDDTVMGLLKKYLSNEFGRNMDEDVFTWRMTDGSAMWLLDGLDEVINRDSRFVDYLEELLRAGKEDNGGPPLALVCVRDSLLASNVHLKRFCDESAGDVAVYELKGWELESKRAFAQKTLARRGDDAPERFIAALEARPELDELACTPFYCVLLRDEFLGGRLNKPMTELQLIERGMSEMIDREYTEKGLDAHEVPREVLHDFLKELAVTDMMNDFQGLPVETAQEYALLALPTAAAANEGLANRMVQLPLLRSSDAGHLVFSHEALEQYLVGVALRDSLEGNEGLFLSRLAARRIPADSAALKVLAQAVSDQGRSGDLMMMVTQRHFDAVTFLNLVQVMALASIGTDRMKPLAVAGRNLTGAIFRELDLAGVSFDGADLTEVTFERCDLRRASFAGAVLSGTRFHLGAEGSLSDARFGDLSAAHSIEVDAARTLDRHADIREWVVQATGIRTGAVSPCPAAEQLHYLFGKFFEGHQLGRASRRYDGILRGKSFFDPESTLRAAINEGYLREERRTKQAHYVIRPNDPQKLSEVSGFAQGYSLTPGLVRLLDRVCGDDQCAHVPQAV